MSTCAKHGCDELADVISERIEDGDNSRLEIVRYDYCRKHRFGEHYCTCEGLCIYINYGRQFTLSLCRECNKTPMPTTPELISRRRSDRDRLNYPWGY